MRMLSDCVIFNMYDKGVLSKKVQMYATESYRIISKEDLHDSLEKVRKLFKSVLTAKALHAIETGEIIMETTDDMNLALPVFLPIVKFKKGGKDKVVIDLSHRLIVRKDKESGEIDYSIDIKVLYCLISSAYVALKLCDKNSVLLPETAKISSLIWAKMFNKILEKEIGLGANRDRYNAFMYMAIRFYLTNIIQIPQVTADALSEDYIGTGGKTYMINMIESSIDAHDIDPFKDIQTFCNTLFNFDITGVRGAGKDNLVRGIQFDTYLKRFMLYYGQGALLSLECFPYFFYTIFSACNYSYMLNDHAFDDITGELKDFNKLMISISNEIK